MLTDLIDKYSELIHHGIVIVDRTPGNNYSSSSESGWASLDTGIWARISLEELDEYIAKKSAEEKEKTV